MKKAAGFVNPSEMKSVGADRFLPRASDEPSLTPQA